MPHCENIAKLSPAELMKVLHEHRALPKVRDLTKSVYLGQLNHLPAYENRSAFFH